MGAQLCEDLRTKLRRVNYKCKLAGTNLPCRECKYIHHQPLGISHIQCTNMCITVPYYDTEICLMLLHSYILTVESCVTTQATVTSSLLGANGFFSHHVQAKTLEITVKLSEAEMRAVSAP